MSSSSFDLFSFPPRPSKLARKRTRAEFDLQTRYRLVQDYLKGRHTQEELLEANPGLTKAIFQKWLRQKDQILEIGASGIGLQKKRIHKRSPLSKVRQELLQFLNQHSDTIIDPTFVGRKAKEIAQDLLQKHVRTLSYQQTLTDEEVSALEKFTGSTAWGRTFLQDYYQQQNRNDDALLFEGDAATTTTAGGANNQLQLAAATASGAKTTDDDDSGDEQALGLGAYHLCKECFEEMCEMAQSKQLKKILLRGLVQTRQVMIDNGGVPGKEDEDSPKKKKKQKQSRT